MECYTTGRQVGSVKRSRWPRRQWASDRELSNLERLLGDRTNPAKTWNHRQWQFGLQVDVKRLSAPCAKEAIFLLVENVGIGLQKKYFYQRRSNVGSPHILCELKGIKTEILRVYLDTVDSVFVLRKCGGNDGASVPPTKTKTIISSCFIDIIDKVLHRRTLSPFMHVCGL